MSVATVESLISSLSLQDKDKVAESVVQRDFTPDHWAISNEVWARLCLTDQEVIALGPLAQEATGKHEGGTPFTSAHEITSFVGGPWSINIIFVGYVADNKTFLSFHTFIGLIGLGINPRATPNKWVKGQEYSGRLDEGGRTRIGKLPLPGEPSFDIWIPIPEDLSGSTINAIVLANVSGKSYPKVFEIINVKESKA
ncbi:hypothetical protein ONZ45_g11572 [Pleurotus djamor]|nr:hypothetical protein ONZ45_g11572 [Pleurotus djamor]